MRAYHQGEILLGNLVARQSLILAFSDAFYVMAVVLLIAALAVVLTKPGRAHTTEVHAS
jgi:DHA2 family multidrug resistance protein